MLILQLTVDVVSALPVVKSVDEVIDSWAEPDVQDPGLRTTMADVEHGTQS